MDIKPFTRWVRRGDHYHLIWIPPNCVTGAEDVELIKITTEKTKRGGTGRPIVSAYRVYHTAARDLHSLFDYVRPVPEIVHPRTVLAAVKKEAELVLCFYRRLECSYLWPMVDGRWLTLERFPGATAEGNCEFCTNLERRKNQRPPTVIVGGPSVYPGAGRDPNTVGTLAQNPIGNPPRAPGGMERSQDDDATGSPFSDEFYYHLWSKFRLDEPEPYRANGTKALADHERQELLRDIVGLLNKADRGL